MPQRYTSWVATQSPCDAPTFPSDSAGITARKLRRSYVSRSTQLVGDAQSAGVLAPQPDARLLRDLSFGALNAVSLASRPSNDTADALQALLGFRARRSDTRAR
jgi:TetR/AcrR family transcriptional regulator, cholesterol catabolism regulator